MSLHVVTLFELRNRQQLPEYRQWSAEVVRPVMRAMPSVRAFKDYLIVGQMDGLDLGFQLGEIIEIADVEAFERDNATGEGKRLGDEWRTRCGRWSVIYLDDLVGQ